MDVRCTLLVSVCLLILNLPARGADRPLLICFGDSITAGYGLTSEEAYPAALQRDLDKNGYRYSVQNMGTPGATSKDAVAAVSSLVRLHPAIAVVEFGGNDGLRGLPLDQTRRNLDEVLSALEGAHIRVLLAGITLPPNYGPDYIHQFDQMYADLASRHHAALVPMIYKDLVRVPGTIQADGIHPTAKGSEIIAQTLLRALKPLMRREK